MKKYIPVLISAITAFAAVWYADSKRTSDEPERGLAETVKTFDPMVLALVIGGLALGAGAIAQAVLDRKSDEE